MLDQVDVTLLTKSQKDAAHDAETERSLLATMERWGPEQRVIHCSNCRHCLVSGPWPYPQAACAEGHGKPRALGSLIRSIHAPGFQVAADCVDFDSMSDR